MQRRAGELDLPPRSLVVLEASNTVGVRDDVPGPARRWPRPAARRRPRRRRSPPRGTPTPSSAPTTTACASSGAPGRRRPASCTPTWRCSSARPARRARRSSCGCPTRNLAQQRPGDRRVPGPDTGRPRHHVPPAALLLRPVGAALPPRRRRRRRHDLGLRRRSVLRRGDGRRPGHQPRRRAAHLRAPRTGGPDLVHVPSLRFVTQAGGRMRARAGAGRGPSAAAQWDAAFFVMYGQTEATARMAYLPPALATEPPAGDRPGDPRRPSRAAARRRRAGRRRRARLPRSQRHARVRHGAVRSGARGHRSTSWRPATWPATTPTDDVFEIVGRRSRFVKPFGLAHRPRRGRGRARRRRVRRRGHRRRRRARRRCTGRTGRGDHSSGSSP